MPLLTVVCFCHIYLSIISLELRAGRPPLTFIVPCAKIESAMVTRTVKFKFTPRPEIDEILSKVKVMEQKAVNWLIANKKTALGSVHSALYYPLREQFPELHSKWVDSALKTAVGVVHQFNKRKRKGKAKRPNLKKPYVSLHSQLYKVSWNGKLLKVTIVKIAHDLEPITLWFRPHHKYRELLDRWQKGECKVGQITLTRTTLSIPLQFSSVSIYIPKTVIGIDSNENSLDYFEPISGELNSVDISEVARINRDHERRIRKGTRGKQNPKAKAKIIRKHNRLRKEKTKTFWYSLALWFISLASHYQAALVLEKLSGMKGRLNIASKRMRQRLLNYWSIMTFHRILEAKCKEHGVPILFVDSQGTSKSCPICGACLRGQDKKCPSCGLSRHYVAAINIAHRGLKEFPSLSGLGQGLVGNPRSLPSDSMVGGRRSAVTAGI